MDGEEDDENPSSMIDNDNVVDNTTTNGPAIDPSLAKRAPPSAKQKPKKPKRKKLTSVKKKATVNGKSIQVDSDMNSDLSDCDFVTNNEDTPIATRTCRLRSDGPAEITNDKGPSGSDSTIPVTNENNRTIDNENTTATNDNTTVTNENENEKSVNENTTVTNENITETNNR